MQKPSAAIAFMKTPNLSPAFATLDALEKKLNVGGEELSAKTAKAAAPKSNAGAALGVVIQDLVVETKKRRHGSPRKNPDATTDELGDAPPKRKRGM